jgi:acyl-CoA synthetase (AMP-forming)/AMP-acid ligase II
MTEEIKRFQETFEKEYTWIEGFRRNVYRYGDKPALIDPASEKSWSYRQLDAVANQVAHALLADQIQKGDVVMYQLLNCPEFVFLYLACHKLSAVNCPINYRLSAGEIAGNLEDSQPAVLVFEERNQKEIQKALELSHFVPRRLIMVRETENPVLPPKVIDFESYWKEQSTEEPTLAWDHNIYDETTRLYTSGTTGRQKGVPLTSLNEVLSSHDVIIHFPMNQRDITMNSTPWFHRGGLHCAGPAPTLYVGGTLVVMRKFDTEDCLNLIGKYKLTFLIGVPAILERLCDAQELNPRDLSSLQGIVTMGSPLEKEACIRYQKVLTPRIFNGYGTTETFWNTFLRPFDLPDRAGTAGASCLDDEVRIVKSYPDRRAEPDDEVARDGKEVGEVIIKCVAKSTGCYHQNPTMTEAKFYKGFAYTGDLGTWDQDHFVSIVGRKDDMIISQGENIYPTQVEEVLNSCDKVADCLVTGVPDPIRGEIVTAYIVKRDPSLTVAQLDAFCKESPMLSNYKRPRLYQFIEEIPRNATGKKLHCVLKKQALTDLQNHLFEKC